MSVMAAELSRVGRDEDGATMPWGSDGGPQLCLPEPAM